jgi:cell wall-associated NlpC family hydrolase
MQQDGLGRTLDPAESKKLQRGDLIFWKGHVAIVRDAETIVHANAHHMATVIENTGEAIARIRKAGSEVTSIKRLA